MDIWLDLLLSCTCGLQLAGLWLRLSRQNQTALWTAGSNATIALALSVIALGGSGSPQGWKMFLAGVVALQCACLITVATGVIVRRLAGILFWPVWLWNFHLIYVLVRVRFFFRVYF